jgi:hypothetical protein
MIMAVVALAFAATAVSASCLGSLSTDVFVSACRPFNPQNPDDSFPLVSEVLEKSCGSLDCHGALARPLRLYGSTGLRRPEPDLGSEGCTAAENNCGDGRTCTEGIGCLDSGIKNYAEYYSGGSIATTPSEQLENWRSLCGLEPEITTLVFCCGAGDGTCAFDYAATCANEDDYDPVRMTLVRKARLREKHKGGQIWGAGDAGDLCLTLWLTGRADADVVTACRDALMTL